jgi:dTDP-glucose 4,6-dehydratase
MKIICVTGALGFMASYFVRSCLSRGWYVAGIDKIDIVSNIHLLDEFNKSNRFKFIKQDINELTELYDCDFVVNFAASSHVERSLHYSKQFLYDNVNGVYNLLELIRQKQKEARPVFIHISTDETYGDIEHGSHIETDLLKPSNPYSASKACADMLILAWARTYEIQYNIIRPTNNYGICQYPEKLIPRICKSIKLERKIPLHNNGTPKRIWLHAQDTTDGILTVIDKGLRNEIYNISGNCELKNVDVVSKIVKLMTGNDDPTPYCNMNFHRPGQDIRYSLNDNKLKALGWECKKDFDKELPAVVEYYKTKFVW